MNDTTNNLENIYLTVWKRMLDDILGWPEQKVVDWAAKYKLFLADPTDAIYHADPQYWAISEFIPAVVREKLSPSQRSCLTKELLDTFGVKMYLTDYLGVDWKQYKSSIDTIVERYAALETVGTK